MLIALLTLLFSVQSQTPASLTTMLDQGLSWTDYLASTKQQRETWVRNAGRAVPDELVDRLKKAGAGLRLLVVAEDWCSDSVNSIPYLGTLATKAGIDLRVINSQVGKTLMEAHRTPDGRAATPTVILVRDGKEAAAWVERPAVLQTWFVGMADKIDTSERQQRKLNWYDWSRGDDALREIVALAERPAKAPAERE
jgi:hypothetical protein